MTENDPLRSVMQSVTIEDVRLIEALIRSSIRSPKEIPQAELNVKHSAHLYKRTNNVFSVKAGFNATIATKDQDVDEASAPVFMRAVFELRYALPTELDSVDDATLNRFADVNGKFNAWPYWREFIHSSLARMGLPPVMLPVFRMESSTTTSPASQVQASLPEKARTIAKPRRRVVRGKKRRAKSASPQ